LILYATSFQNTANTLSKWISLVSLVRYQNPSVNPSGFNRILQLRGYDNPIGTPFFDSPKTFSSSLVSINFKRLNDAPIVTTGVNTEWIDPGPVFLAPNFFISDVESMISEVNITIVTNCYTNDLLLVNASLLSSNAASVISSSLFSACSIQLKSNSTSGFASPDDFNNYVRSLQFQTLLLPKELRTVAAQPRVFLYTVKDVAPEGEGLTNLTASAFSTLNLVPWDAEPVLNGILNSSIIFDASAGVGVFLSSLGTISISDIDSYFLLSVEISIITSCGVGDSLSYSSQVAATLNNGTTPLVIISNPSYCSIKVFGIETLDTYAAVLQSISFSNFYSSPGNGTRRLSIKLTQYTPSIPDIKFILNANSTTDSFVFDLFFRDVKTAPILSIGSRSPLQYYQLSPPVEICSGAILSDAQSDFIQQVTASISNGCQFGDVLSHHVNDITSLGIEALPYIPFQSQNNFSNADLTFNDGAGNNCSLTFIGLSSVIAYSEVISHITFSNMYTDLIPGNRTISIAATDLCSPKTGPMKNLTGIANATVFVAKVQKPPLVETSSVCSVQYIEGVSQLIDANVNVVDPEAFDRVFNASVSITSGCTFGDILMLSPTGTSLASSESIVSEYNSSTCSLSFSSSSFTGGMTTDVITNLFRTVLFLN